MLALISEILGLVLLVGQLSEMSFYNQPPNWPVLIIGGLLLVSGLVGNL